MITEQVTKQIAILANEAGFRDYCDYYYKKHSTYLSNNNFKKPINPQNNTVFLAPTYSQLIKWLDKKYIFIAIIPIRIGSSYRYTYTIDPSELPIQTKTSLTFPTREDALEKAFTVALIFLINGK